MSNEIQRSIHDAVSAALRERTFAGPEELHAYLWPFVLAGFGELVPTPTTAEEEAETPKRDRRTRPWQYVARFWRTDPNGEELAGETDPAIIRGTGELVPIILGLAAQLHDDAAFTLDEAAIKEKLPQFRNNLGRGRNATLRLSYDAYERGDGADPTRYICQVDVYRLDG